MKTTFGKSSMVVALWCLALAAGGCSGELGEGLGEGASEGPSEGLGEVSDEVHANPGSSTTPTREDNRQRGRYPEVMLIKSIRQDGSGYYCTGTVVGPHAVLTAAHCGGPGDAGMSAVYATWWGDADLPATRAFRSPYLNAPFQPSWWVSLNNAQKAAPGGRQDDWPAMHDHMLLFVPDLTPQYMAARGITPAAVDAQMTGTGYTIVGVGSTGGASRDFYASRFVNATANTITVNPRDGYLSRDATTANFGVADGGDSGGPTLGARSLRWTDGTWLEWGRFIVGTAQNPTDTAPLAYNPGITMTTNQRLTVRLNGLWVQARADDPDGDGLPTECDPSSATANWSSPTCPASVGGPTALSSQYLTSPVGRLACRPGYMATGLRGRSGALIDKLSVHCQALSCFYRGDTSCTGAANEYWTDEFGGDGGGPWQNDCPAGQVMVGIGGTETPGSYLRSLAPRCKPFSDAIAGTGAASERTRYGDAATGQNFTSDCAGKSQFIGFQARTSNLPWVTGLQPICSVEHTRYQSPYQGGGGGGGSVVRCPDGQVAYGTVQSAESNMVNMFGLLCAPRSYAAQGIVPPDSAITVARGGYRHYSAGLDVPAMVEPLTSAHLPPTTQYARCPAGQRLYSLIGSASWAVEQIAGIFCQNEANTAGSAVNIGVGNPNAYGNATWTCPGTISQPADGNESMPAQCYDNLDNDGDSFVDCEDKNCCSVRDCAREAPTSYCGKQGGPGPASGIDGLYIRNGWLTDGFTFHCVRLPAARVSSRPADGWSGLLLGFASARLEAWSRLRPALVRSGAEGEHLEPRPAPEGGQRHPQGGGARRRRSARPRSEGRGGRARPGPAAARAAGRRR